MPDPLKLRATKPLAHVAAAARLQHFANDSPGRRLSALFIERLFTVLGRVSLACALLAFALIPMGTRASTIPQPVISIIAADAQLSQLTLVPVFTWRTDIGRPLAFGMQISRTDTSSVDVYFGVLAPDGRFFSWVPQTGSAPLLLEGLYPAGRAITATAISSAGLLGSDPRHLFAHGHPLGIYSVAVILVATAADPTDPRQWFAASMSPLLISN